MLFHAAISFCWSQKTVLFLRGGAPLFWCAGCRATGCKAVAEGNEAQRYRRNAAMRCCDVSGGAALRHSFGMNTARCFRRSNVAFFLRGRSFRTVFPASIACRFLTLRTSARRSSIALRATRSMRSPPSQDCNNTNTHTSDPSRSAHPAPPCTHPHPASDTADRPIRT